MEKRPTRETPKQTKNINKLPKPSEVTSEENISQGIENAMEYQLIFLMNLFDKSWSSHPNSTLSVYKIFCR